jgi:hypothetical protein
LRTKSHEDFVNVLKTGNGISETQVGFKSVNHVISTQTKKLSNIISSNDNKRELDLRFDDKIHTVPFGYNYIN